MPLTIAQPTGGAMSSLDAGSVTNPAVNAVICDSGLLGAGNSQQTYWKVVVTSFQTGTVDANLANMLVNVGGAGNPVTGGITIGKLQSAVTFSTQMFRVVIPAGGGHVFITSGSAASGAVAVYNASMSLTRLQSPMADI